MKRLRVGRVSQERTLPLDTDKVFGLQLVEMVRQSRVWDSNST